MRSKKVNILLYVLLSLLLFSNTAFAQSNSSKLLIDKDTTKSINNIINDKKVEFKIKNNVYSLTNSNVTINKLIQLYDVNGEPNYLLAIFNEGGYAIVTNQDGIISECSLESGNSYPYKNYINSGLIYAGPGNYIVEKNNQHYESRSGKVINLKITDELIDKNNIILNQYQKMSSDVNLMVPSTLSTSTTWTGISSSRFQRYVQWKNNDDTCGTYATAVMLAYLDDYIDNTFVPSSVRTRSSTSPGTLISELKAFIGDDGSGTYPSDLNFGIGKFMTHYSLNHRQSSSELILVDTWAKASIDKDWPVVLGMLSLFGSPYGNHWVTAYAYSGEYYKAHDNWGSYEAIIKNDWTTGVVWMVN